MTHNLPCALSLPLEASGPWPQLTCPLVSSEGRKGLGVGAARAGSTVSILSRWAAGTDPAKGTHHIRLPIPVKWFLHH